VTEQEYTEPTNAQLASFLSVYARNFPGGHWLNVSPSILEWMFERNPNHRITALKFHREFQEKINELSAKILEGEMQCEHIRPNNKRCPNHNQPGSHYCGLHQSEEDE
jgi:hypothetical protein